MNNEFEALPQDVLRDSLIDFIDLHFPPRHLARVLNMGLCLDNLTDALNGLSVDHLSQIVDNAHDPDFVLAR